MFPWFSRKSRHRHFGDGSTTRASWSTATMKPGTKCSEVSSWVAMVMDGQFSWFYRFFKGGEWYVHTMFHSYLRLSKGMYVSSFVWQIPRNVWKILTYLLVSPGVFLGYRRIWYGVLLTNWDIQAPNHKSKLHVPWKTVPSCLHSLSYQPHDSIFTLHQKIYVTPGLVQLNSHYDNIYIYIVYTIRSLLQFYPYHLILKASWYRSPNSPSRSASVARSRSPTPSRGHRPWPPPAPSPPGSAPSRRRRRARQVPPRDRPGMGTAQRRFILLQIWKMYHLGSILGVNVGTYSIDGVLGMSILFGMSFRVNK